MISRTFIFSCILCILLLFSGCGKVVNEVLTVKPFESEFEMITKDTEYKGSAFYNGNDHLEVTLTYPETVKGIEIICDGNESRFKNSDIVVLSDDNPIMILNKILSAINVNTAYVNKENRYTVNNINCEIICDQGLPEKISADEYVYKFISEL